MKVENWRGGGWIYVLKDVWSSFNRASKIRVLRKSFEEEFGLVFVVGKVNRLIEMRGEGFQGEFMNDVKVVEDPGRIVRFSQLKYSKGV
jgi:hypothetical protein